MLTPLLSPVTPGHRSRLAGLVKTYGMSRVMLALWTVRIDLFWKLQYHYRPVKGRAELNGSLLSIFFPQCLDLHCVTLTNHAFTILPWKVGNVLF